VEDPHRVTAVHDGDDLAAEHSGGALSVVSLGEDAFEDIPALAELHDEVDRVAVLVGAPELDDVAVSREVVHDLHLPADVFDVVAVDELPGGDGLAGEALPRLAVRDEVGDPELAPPELAAEGVSGAHVLHQPAKHAPHVPCRRRWSGRRRLRLGPGLLWRGGLLRLGLGRRGRLLVVGLAAVARAPIAHGLLACRGLACWGLTNGGRRG
jgi:hypothetical protein